MKQEQNISVLIYADTNDRYEDRSVLPGNTYNIPPYSTLPWQQQLQFFRFSALPGNSTDWPPHHSEVKAGNGIQLYILYSFIYIYLLSLYELCHLELSKWTGQSCICFYANFLWFYHVVVIVHFTTTYICCCCCSCCCVLHIRNNNN